MWATAAGLLCSAGIALPQVWPLAIGGLGLFFWAIVSRSRSVWRASWQGLLFGSATGGAGTAWFLSTLPLDFLGIQDETVQLCAVVMTWLYVAISLGSPFALAAPLIFLCRSWRLFPVVAAIIWATAERGRMWAFAAATWSPTSLFGPHFSVSSVGYPLTESDFLLQLSRPFGIDALNFFAAFLAAQLAILPSLLKKRRPAAAPVMQGAAVLVCLCVPGLTEAAVSPHAGGSLRFALLSENLPEVRDFSSHGAVRELLAQAAAAMPPVDVILLPEEFSLTSIFWAREDARTFIKEHFGERDVLILNSRNELFPADETNSAPDPKKLVYDSTVSGEIGRYEKLMLMPLGEYAPAFTKTFFSAIDDPELQLYIDDVAELPPRGRSVTAATFHGLTIGGLLCSDLLSPSLYATVTREHHADVLVNLANQFWFHGSRLLHWKTLQMARVHAAQNRLPFLLANNMAPSFALDSRGRLLMQSEWGNRGVLYLDVQGRGE